MTEYEKIVGTAYTGVVMCEMDDLQKYATEKLGRLVWTHELALKSVIDEIKKAAEPEFLQIAVRRENASLTAKVAAEIQVLRSDAKETWDAGEADRYEARADALEWVLGQITGENTPCPWTHYPTNRRSDQ